MSQKDTAQNVIDAYRRRQQQAQRAPLIIALIVLLLIVGIGFLIFWLLGPNQPAISLFATETPTPTTTFTPTATATNTATPTVTPTETNTPTPEPTATEPGPFIHTVAEGDNIWDLAIRFKVDRLVLISINNLDPANPILRVGDKLTIPGPDTKLPTATDLPENLPKGTVIDYVVQDGDSLLAIALRFNSTVDEIKKLNKIENENSIYVGQPLKIPVNLVPTQTPAPPTATGAPATATTAATATPTSTATRIP